MQNVFKLLFFGIFMLSLISCGSSRSKIITTKNKDNHTAKVSTSGSSKIINAEKKVGKIISTARRFEGTPYKYGGTNRRGMDCSGLIYTAFSEENIPIPRTSRAMSLEGKRLFIKHVNPGDLLFFETNKNRKVINHVGLVIEVKQNDIYFIHASTSSGVIVSSLSESYWNSAFVMARRVL
ncbi:NlpC/P60 family protein [Salegentibacter sp. 24]|uniref:C40 family peptidase n=1 Tax=Salegentibacter sp. 24 TaxID=2183986 RepID=UPI001061E55E|nr:C40 family peptidase [Salegentibacter sp. 24]TDN95333.1 NlpC/P60 family protein [Salegentibacter sp. 24]